MPELSDPLSRDDRRALRVSGIQALVAQRARMDLQLRQELAVLAGEDTVCSYRCYVADELALALSESPRTTARWLEEAQMFCDFPVVMGKVADGTWTARHADAVLSELVGTSRAVQAQVLDLVLGQADARTPYELRKATRAARLLHDLDAAEQRQQSIHDNRRLQFSDETDGSASAWLNGTKTSLATLRAALETAVGVPQPGDSRSFTQRCFDYLLDLVCGRVSVTTPWQALIVVSLETLQGGDAPAEIPGLGLVTAEEARDVLGQAELRRVVVDEHGVMVSVDSFVHTPDITDGTKAPTEQPVLVSDASEPAPVDDREPAATQSDEDWLAAQPAEQRAALRALDQVVLPTLDDLCEQQWTQLDAELEAFLSWHARQRALAGAGITVRRGGVEQLRWRPPDPPDGTAGPPDGPGPHRPGGDGGGGTPPPDRPPRPGAGDTRSPEPPTDADRDWLEIREDLDRTQDQLDWQTHAQHRSVNPSSVLHLPRPPHLAPSLLAQQRRTQRLRRRAELARWTSAGLATAVKRMLSTPVQPKPDASKGYLFRGRVAHWLKTRDITCTFPGCTLLSQRCQSDHVIEYPAGPTHVDNAASECTHHHQAKHASIPARRLPDGTMRWQPPSSRYIDRPPRPLLRGW
ncbi:MAG: hypothetical protein QOD70_2818 [Frankiales bacterium]|nr:hypothetical protein [Frankiales bacterium]